MGFDFIFEQVLLLFIFVVAGYVLGKASLCKPEHCKTLSTMLVYVFLPCLYFNNFAENLTVEYLKTKYPLILASVGLLLVFVLLSKLIGNKMTKHPYERVVLRYSLTVPNYGYMGCALCGSLFGSKALLDMMIFGLPLSVYISTSGYNMLTRNEGKISLKRIMTPPMYGILLGCIVGLTGLKLPNVLTEVAQKGAACMSPVAMLLSGIAVSEFKFKELLVNKQAYIVVALRLLGLPLLAFALVKLIRMDMALMPAVLVYSMPCGMNTIIYPKMVGEDCRTGAGLVLISSVLCVITIPLCLYFLL